MAIVGDAEQVRARIRAYAEQGVDVCVINPIADPNGIEKAITSIAGCLDGVQATKAACCAQRARRVRARSGLT